MDDVEEDAQISNLYRRDSTIERLVLGDALGPVTLTPDDLQSQRHINTLSSHIRENLKQPTDPEIRQHQRAVELRQMLRTNRIEIERNRVTESFPRLFSVLLRLPLGSRVTFTAMNRDQTPNISFDECETTFTTRNLNERRVVYRMLEASGWSRDGFEEEYAAFRGCTSGSVPEAET